MKKNIVNWKLFFQTILFGVQQAHIDEEEIILKSHFLMKQKGCKIITIIIPRHIDRSKDIREISKKFKIECQIINKFEDISKRSEILIINSIGELINYFHNCKSVFMGKSLAKKLIKVSGQNPIEPAKCGCKIYHGPLFKNLK